MGYNDFFIREDVYQILKDTISLYYHIEVSFVAKVTKTNNHNLEIFYCIPKLNSIFHSRIDKRELKKYLKNNMIGNQNFFVQLLLKLYINIAIYFPYLFSDKIMLINSNKINSYLIYPGNKRIKIIDFSKNTVTNILKNGFSDKWFLNDFNFRSSSNRYYVNKTHKISNISYYERLLHGKPLARLNNRFQNFHTDEVIQIIKDMQYEIKHILICDYIESLCNDINSLVTNDHNIINNITELINNIKKYFSDKTYHICITFSHGDLQKGNVFVGETELYILDWETYSTRSCVYDLLIYLYNLRNSYNLLDNMMFMLNDENINFKSFNWVGSKKDLLLLFILEDIAWQFEESSQLLTGNFSNGLIEYNKKDFSDFVFKLLNNK